MKGHSVHGTRSLLVQSKNKPEACVEWLSAHQHQLLQIQSCRTAPFAKAVSSGSKGTLQENPSLMTILVLDTVTKIMSYLQSGYSLEKCKLII